MRMAAGETRADVYIVELATPAAGWTELQALTASARRVAARIRRRGVPVRFLRSVFVPEQDRCFFLYQAQSGDSVREATAGLELGSSYVSEALRLPELARGPA